MKTEMTCISIPTDSITAFLGEHSPSNKYSTLSLVCSAQQTSGEFQENETKSVVKNLTTNVKVTSMERFGHAISAILSNYSSRTIRMSVFTELLRRINVDIACNNRLLSVTVDESDIEKQGGINNVNNRQVGVKSCSQLWLRFPPLPC